MIPNNHEVSLHKFLQVCQTAQVHKLQRHVHNHGALGHEPWESTNMGPPMINSPAVNIIYTYIYIYPRLRLIKVWIDGSTQKNTLIRLYIRFLTCSEDFQPEKMRGSPIVSSWEHARVPACVPMDQIHASVRTPFGDVEGQMPCDGKKF